MFTGGALREAVQSGRADFVPIFCRTSPVCSPRAKINFRWAASAFAARSSWTLHTLDVSVDAALAACATAPFLLVETNRQMPRTHGNSVLSLSRVVALCETDRPLHGYHSEPMTAVEDATGEIVANLVPYRACLQMGIGGIPNVVLARLKGKMISALTPRCFRTASSI